jgi:hypothetical protein
MALLLGKYCSSFDERKDSSEDNAIWLTKKPVERKVSMPTSVDEIESLRNPSSPGVSRPDQCER